MAGTITHAYFIMDVYDRLDIKTREKLMDQKGLLKIAAQSMDILYFYNMVNIRFNKGKRIRQFGYFFHDNNTLEFFETLINYIKYNNYYNDAQVMAYLYGMLSHYILDSTIHPYVYYKTGNYTKGDPSTYKYNQLHSKLENYLDCYLVQLKEGYSPHKFKCHNFCFKIDTFHDNLKEVINFTFKEVFDINNMSKFYYHSIKQTRSFYRVFRYDPIGFKKFTYRLFDIVTPKSIISTEVVSYHLKLKSIRKNFNMEHHTWYNPSSKRIKSNKSLLELYTQALNQTTVVINELNRYIYNDEKVSLKQLIKNNSYITGRDCNKKEELKFFEF